LAQTDSTRSRNQELQYQQRLTSELEKLREKEAHNISELSKSLSDEAEKPAEPTEPSLIEKISDATSSASTLAEKQRQKDMSNSSVSKEIEALKKKLDARKKLEQADPQVNKAKADVAACLRMHDRRPLDCWKEVENFKKEVGRLERDFVEKTIR
jgi:altered-inheritance-of-mitochondria protein 13